MSVSLDSISTQLTALAVEVSSLKSQLALVMDKLGVEVPKTKGKRAAKSADVSDAPKAVRPPNAYMNYCNAKRAEVKAANPDAKLADLSKIMGAQWMALAADQKAAYAKPVVA